MLDMDEQLYTMVCIGLVIPNQCHQPDDDL